MRPLFKRRGEVALVWKGNRGLYFNKFFDQWQAGFEGVIEPSRDQPARVDYFGGKMNWILSQIHDRARADGKFRVDGTGIAKAHPAGDKGQLEAANARLAALCTALSAGTSAEGPRRFRTSGPFVTGMGLAHPLENGFLWHHTLGVPYLPGSSIKGMIRAWARVWLEEEETAERLFGRDDRHAEGMAAGCLIVFDALPTGPVELMAEVITPHDGGWRIKDGVTPADWLSPNPIPFLAVAPGAEFQFALAPRPAADAGDLATAYAYLEQALEWIGAGAKTAVGFGRFMTPEALAAARDAVRQAEKRHQKKREEALKQAPPGVGDDAEHEEWRAVTVLEIRGDMALVYSKDEAEEVELPLNELKRP